MMLRTGGDVRFKHRPVEGARPPLSTHVERLVLDGQQRMTSLYQSIMLDEAVETQDVRKKAIRGWFYVDMRAALDSNVDREDAVRFLPADKKVRSFRNDVIEDYSTQDGSRTMATCRRDGGLPHDGVGAAAQVRCSIPGRPARWTTRAGTQGGGGCARTEVAGVR